MSESISDDHDLLPMSPPLDDWSGNEIEDAYRKALEASEALGEEDVLNELPGSSEQTDESPEAVPTATTDAAAPAVIAADDAPQRLVQPATDLTPAEEPGTPTVTPTQIIEAALFVGGGPLTARKLVGLLRGSFDNQFVEQSIDSLNQQYAEQARPYEIRLGDGGYRLQLLADFEKYRHRVYGTGPREVKLSQEILEILALVAYKQPIAQAEIEGLGKKSAGSLLRQLLRRELIGLTRGDGGPKDIRYHTTPRFLQLFGLGSLNDLPRSEDVAVK